MTYNWKLIISFLLIGIWAFVVNYSVYLLAQRYNIANWTGGLLVLASVLVFPGFFCAIWKKEIAEFKARMEGNDGTDSDSDNA
jgi:hypothetical protein